MESLPRLPVLLLYLSDPSWADEDREKVNSESRRLGHAIRRQGRSVTFLPVSDPDLESVLSGYDPEEVLVFNWCEDIPGVDRGEPLVAETLESMSFTYTGSSAETLEFSYDKIRVKERLAALSLPTPAWAVVSSLSELAWNAFPAIVKPAFEHCSHGIDEGAIVMNPDELRRRVAYVLDEWAQPAIVEEFIDGREFHVPMWGNESVEMLPPVEMDFSCLQDIRTRLCSYDAKFSPDSYAYREIKSFVPARLSADEMRELESVSRGAYEAVGCRDYGRIDIRLRDGVFYVLDVNPNADISADASLALAADKAGYCYGAMGGRVLDFAAQRHPQNWAPHQ